MSAIEWFFITILLFMHSLLGAWAMSKFFSIKHDHHSEKLIHLQSRASDLEQVVNSHILDRALHK